MSTDQPPFDEETTGHLSMDEIADLGEGLLSDEQALGARAHLAGCVECNDRAGALDAATNALRDLGPVTMPADVAARIDAALAAEATAPATAPDAVAASNVTVMPDPNAIPRQRFRLPTAPSAAAAAVIVLAAGAIIVGHHHHHNNGISIESGTRAQAPLVRNAPGGASAVTPVSTGRLYDPNNLGSLVPGLLTTSTPSLSPAGTPNSQTLDNTGSAGGSTVTDGTTGSYGTNPGTGTAAGSTPKKSQKHGSSGTAKTPQAPVASGPSLSGLTTNAPVPSALRAYQQDRQSLLNCAAYITSTPGAVPVAVDFGHWRNPATSPPTKSTPALILVFTNIRNSNDVDVYVVAPACNGGSLYIEKTISVSG